MNELIIQLINIQARITHETNSRRGLTKKTIKEEMRILKEISKVVDIDIDYILEHTR